jgi:nucleotide-binding universal stress UspA family protein
VVQEKKEVEIIMICSKILVAYDGSDLAKAAVKKAREIAALDPATKIHAVHVVNLMAPVIGGIGAEAIVNDNMYKMGAVRITELEEIMSQIENPTKVVLLAGQSPANEIVKYANDENCDLIIIGSKGLGGIKKLLGSVSNGVVQNAEIPVLVIK